MAVDAKPSPPWKPVLRWGVPLAMLLVATIAVSQQTFVELEPAIAVAIAAVLAAIVALMTARRLALPLLILAVLSWSGAKSDLDPGLLVQNRERAVEYVFGRNLTDAQIAESYQSAERSLMLSLQRQARLQVTEELGLGIGQARPDGFDTAVAERATQLRNETTLEEWDALVERQARRVQRERSGGFFPPETELGSLRLYADALLETVAIAIWGTLLAMVTALPVAVLGSNRTMSILSTASGPLPRALRRVGVFFTRRGFDACRGFNEFVLALIFVAIIGLGPFAGVMALAVHTFGVLGKVFADALETVQQGEIDGVTATGASSTQVLSFAVLPQIMPYVVSQTLLRFESNVRSASVLGLVGAGGIGFLIDAKLKSYDFQEVATMMIMIIVVVSLIDFACGRIMKRFT
ncbi:MAG: phosphonate ABC transporter, permease protein PhnE [Planctomycetota bacterium]